MTKFVKCKALVACTEFVAGHGMVHMNPDDPDHAVVEIPEQAVARLVDDDRVVVLGNPLDHDDDGKAGGSKARSGDEVSALRAEYKAKVGRNPFNGWDADTLRAKIAEASTNQDGGKAGGEPVTEAQNAAEEGGVADDNTSDSSASTEDTAP